MTRAEILSEIKKAEEEALALVAQAREAKNKKISDALARSKEIIRMGEEEAKNNAESEIAQARVRIQKEREKILEKGTEQAENVKKQAKKNIAKATKFILKEFERAANA